MKRLTFVILACFLFFSGCSSWFKGELTIANESYRTLHEIYLGGHGFYKNIEPGKSATIKCDPGNYKVRVVGDNYTWDIDSVLIEKRKETVLKIKEPTYIPVPAPPQAESNPVEYYPPVPQISAVVPPILLDIDWTDVIILPPWPTPTPDGPHN